MSIMLDKVKTGIYFWSEKRVRDVGKIGKITQEECDIILSAKE